MPPLLPSPPNPQLPKVEPVLVCAAPKELVLVAVPPNVLVLLWPPNRPVMTP